MGDQAGPRCNNGPKKHQKIILLLAAEKMEAKYHIIANFAIPLRISTFVQTVNANYHTSLLYGLRCYPVGIRKY